MIWKQNFPTPRIQFASRGAMSSLAACQADGYYYPPDWTPDGGSQSLRATVGVKGAKAALGKKNGKLKPPQKTIRFEMPFDVGCFRCDQTIGKGVRFNAVKKAVGRYLSTTVWGFEMKLACCGTFVEIRTNPQRSDFDLVTGVKKRLGGANACTDRGGANAPTDSFGHQTHDSGQITVELQTREERDLLVGNGMARLERTFAAGAQGRAADASQFFDKELKTRKDDDQFGGALPVTHLERTGTQHAVTDNTHLIREQSDALFKNDYHANRALRSAARVARKKIAANAKRRDALGLPSHVELLPVTVEDTELARRAFRSGYTTVSDVHKRKKTQTTDPFERHKRAARKTINESSIFSAPRGLVQPKHAASKSGGSRNGGQRALALLTARKGKSENDSRAVHLANRSCVGASAGSYPSAEYG